MAQNNNFIPPFFGADFSTFLNGADSTQVDVKSLLETQRKNTQAVNDAMKVAGEGFQAYAQRCAELMSQFVEDQSALAQEIVSEGSPEEKISKQAELIKKNYDKSVGNVRELAELINSSNTKATELINKRVSASLTEMKSALANANKPKAATKKAS